MAGPRMSMKGAKSVHRRTHPEMPLRQWLRAMGHLYGPATMAGKAARIAGRLPR